MGDADVEHDLDADVGEPQRTIGDRPVEELVERPAASAGAVVAAAALAAAFLPWTDATPLLPAVAGASSTPAAVLAALAIGAFVLRRYGRLDRRPGAALAGVAAAGVVLAALVRFLAPATGGGADPAVGAGLPLAGTAGALAVGLAIADAREVTAGRLVEMARRSVTGLGLIIGAYLVLFVVASPLRGIDFDPVTGLVVTVVLTDVVFAAVAVAFLLASGRGLAFVDLRWPGVRDLAWMGAGIVGLFVTLVSLRLATLALGLPSTGNNVVRPALEGHPETLLVLALFSFLLVAPAEELLNRNVIQKYLYGSFTRPGAIVVASAIFAGAHVFSYSGDTVVGLFVSLLSVFVLSLVLGGIYERTENLVVPILVHAVFNAAQFLLLYVALVFGDASGIAAALP